MIISTACVVTFSAAPGRFQVKIGRVKMQSALKGAGRVPAECQKVSLRAPSDEQVHQHENPIETDWTPIEFSIGFNWFQLVPIGFNWSQ